MAYDTILTSRRLMLGGGAGLLAAGLGSALITQWHGLRQAEETLAAIGVGAAPPRVLIRSIWQIENIGDIAHGIGMATLVRRAMPEAVITLWTARLNDALRALLARALPGVTILELGTSRVQERIVLASASVLISSSSPGLAARSAIAKWLDHGARPYGLFGLTWTAGNAQEKAMIERAAFAFFRDSASVKQARSAGLGRAAWVPDDAFACPPATAAAETARLPTGFAPRGYVCCIPRYRHTPGWANGRRPFDPVEAAFNAAHVEADHAALRTAMIRAVREAGVSLLICPEDTSQIALGRTALYDPLPSDVKAKAHVLGRFWMPDEAMATFGSAAAVLSADQHSAILALTQGVPALLCRSREQTSKGLMWNDIGLGEWLFDFDDKTRMQALPEVLARILQDQAAARSTASQALACAQRIQTERMNEAAALLRV